MKYFIRRRPSQPAIVLSDDSSRHTTNNTMSDSPSMSSLASSAGEDGRQRQPQPQQVFIKIHSYDGINGMIHTDNNNNGRTKKGKLILPSHVVRRLWINGDWRDKTILLLLALFFVAWNLWMMHSITTPTTPEAVIVARGLRRPINRSTTIHIPMETVPRNQKPSLVLFRFLEGWSQRELRRTGETALIQFGEQLRELILMGADSFSMIVAMEKNKTPSTATTTAADSSPSASSTTTITSLPMDPYKANLFRTKLQEMAPWLRGRPDHVEWPWNQVPVPSDPKSQAVVICAGDKQMMYLEVLLHSIRNVHESKIPIRIVYAGDSDLSRQSRTKLQKKFGRKLDRNLLRFIDLSAVFDLDEDKVQLRGWNLKPFGILAVPESQVLLLDVDVLLFQSPDIMFQQQGFLETGALFFRDRSHEEHLWTPRQFLLTMQPLLSQAAQKSLVNGNTVNEHIQEAGVVLIDKSRRWRGLWTACLILGRWDVRRFLQRDIIYGDKEVYFGAFETIHEPYAFAKYYPGVVGSVLSDFHGDDIELAPTKQGNSDHLDKLDTEAMLLHPYMALCGRMLHLDDDGLPLWSNGGYLTREDDRTAKEEVAERGLKPILFSDGGDSTCEEGAGGKERNQHWFFSHELGVLCLFPNNRAIRHVPSNTVEKASNVVDFFVRQADRERV